MPQDAQFDRLLLEVIQARVPLVREPYAEFAGRLGRREHEVLSRLSELRTAPGPLREISGIFDVATLGFRQTLVAMRVPKAGLDGAGEAAADHPGVSHCYARTGPYNLWLTLAVSATSKLGLENTAEILARQAEAEGYVLLPTTKRYKLQVSFNPDLSSGIVAAGSHQRQDKLNPAAPARAHLTEAQIRAIRALQIDLPNRSDPFAPLAEAEGLQPDMLLVHAADLLGAGYMRRYAAVLHHRRAGAEANVMVAWQAADRSADAAGAACARLPAVSHCFARKPAEGWPYNLYTMIHGRKPEDCRRTIEQIVAATGLKDSVELWTDKEYKKQRIALFGNQEAKWEDSARASMNT